MPFDQFKANNSPSNWIKINIHLQVSRCSGNRADNTIFKTTKLSKFHEVMGYDVLPGVVGHSSLSLLKVEFQKEARLPKSKTNICSIFCRRATFQ